MTVYNNNTYILLPIITDIPIYSNPVGTDTTCGSVAVAVVVIVVVVVVVVFCS